jgi:hypothetical protein
MTGGCALGRSSVGRSENSLSHCYYSEMPKIVHKRKVGRIIARRELIEIGSNSAVVVSIGTPRRHPKGQWECWFSVERLGKRDVHRVGGADALQALLIAVEGARVALDKTGRRFSWLEYDPDKAGSGIPRYVPTMYGPLVEAHINIAIERESKRYYQRILNGRKANIAAFEAEVNERREVLAILEQSLARRKAGTATWQSDLRKWKPEKTRRVP